MYIRSRQSKIPVRQRQAAIVLPAKRQIVSIDSQYRALVNNATYRLRRDGISQSLLSNWTCRVKFCLACQRWTTPDKGKNTYFGSMVHEICEAMYKALRMFTGKEMDIVLDKYIRKNKEDLLNWTDNNIEFTAAVIKTIMCKYCEIYESDFDKMNILQVENKFSTRMENWGLSQGPLIRGKKDMLFSYKVNPNTIILMEHKTMGTVNEKVLKARLPIDKQNLFYLTEQTYDFHYPDVNDILYNIIRRPQIKRTKEDTILEFCQRLDADIVNRPDFYFLRYPIHYSKVDILMFKNQLNLKLREIDLFTSGDLPMYRNESSCESAYNGIPFVCEYAEVCQSNELRGFIQQKSLFPELED